MNGIIEQLQSHSSIRKFTDQKIDEDLFEDLIRAGQGAATSSFLQGTTIIRVRDAMRRRKLAEVAGGQPYVVSTAEFLVFCADLKRSKDCCDRYDKPFVGDYTEPFLIATVDVALFAQSLVAAAESVGLGICYIGALRNDPQAVADLLQIPDYIYPVFGLCLGYPDQEPEVKPRLPLSVVVKDEVYDDTHDRAAIDGYDLDIVDYYRSRTGGGHGTPWSEQMAGLLSNNRRPHMRNFLAQRGFKLS